MRILLRVKKIERRKDCWSIGLIWGDILLTLAPPLLGLRAKLSASVPCSLFFAMSKVLRFLVCVLMQISWCLSILSSAKLRPQWLHPIKSSRALGIKRDRAGPFPAAGACKSPEKNRNFFFLNSWKNCNFEDDDENWGLSNGFHYYVTGIFNIYIWHIAL